MGFFNRFGRKVKSIFKDYYIELADAISEQRSIIEDAQAITVAGDDLIGRDIKFATIEQAESNIVALVKTLDKFLDQQPDTVMSTDKLQKLLVNNRFPMESKGRIYQSSVSRNNVYFRQYTTMTDFILRNVDVIEFENFYNFGQKSKFTSKMQKLYDTRLKKKLFNFVNDYDDGLSIYFKEKIHPKHYTQFLYFMHKYLAIMISDIEINQKTKIVLDRNEVDFLKFLRAADNPQGFFVISKD